MPDLSEAFLIATHIPVSVGSHFVVPGFFEFDIIEAHGGFVIEASTSTCKLNWLSSKVSNARLHWLYCL